MNVVGHGNVTVSKVLRIRLWKMAAQSSGTDSPGCGGGANFPAFAVTGLKERACMIAKRIAAFENKEFLKISIKFDKLTGFF